MKREWPRLWPLILVCFLEAGAPQTRADRVQYYDADGEIQVIEGHIEQFAEGDLRIRQPHGRLIDIRRGQLIDVEGDWEGLSDQTRLDLTDAERLSRIRQAYAAEERGWAKHVLLARAARLYRRQGNWDDAARMFEVIVRDDPESIHWIDAPLIWQPQQLPATVAKQAATSMKADHPAVRLIAASWALSGSSIFEARRILEQLAESSSPLIGPLATWQLRRLELVQVRPEQLGQWRQELERLPGRLRGGPYFIMGQAYARKGEPMDSVMAFLRVAFLYNHDPLLAAESLFMAAEQLEAGGQPELARQVYEELAAGYPDSRWTPLANEQLRASNGK